jgi:hypothetical protein
MVIEPLPTTASILIRASSFEVRLRVSDSPFMAKERSIELGGALPYPRYLEHQCRHERVHCDQEVDHCQARRAQRQRWNRKEGVTREIFDCTICLVGTSVLIKAVSERCESGTCFNFSSRE